MHIWIITTGEPLAIYNERPHRAEMLTRALYNRSHSVTRWTTTFDHQKKEYLYVQDKILQTSDKTRLYFLHSVVPYNKNISIRRLINHTLVARKFKKLSSHETSPDLIFCSFPTIELSYEAVKYGKRNNIPVIIDTRDLWPDLFEAPFPPFLKPIIRLLLFSYRRKTRFIFANCDHITAVSEGYLNWALQFGNRKKDSNDKAFPLGFDKINAKNTSLTNQDIFFTDKGVDTSKTIIWFVGTFGQLYDLETVISAATALSNQRDDLQFVLTGDGEKMKCLRKLAHGSNNIVFTGWVNKEQLSYLSSISDIGLMAYNKNATQGLPNKIFEYMSAGIPILSSLQSETKDLIYLNNIGLTYQSEDVESFIEHLHLLLKSKSLFNEMRINSTLLFEESYSSSVVYQRLCNYLESLI